METTRKFTPDRGGITQTAIIIDKLHSCTNCPIRQLAIKQPKSIFARIHLWHKAWWPGWKAHQARACAFAAIAGAGQK